jgi:glycosyltransferase involved in cell wall biosynthesis
MVSRPRVTIVQQSLRRYRVAFYEHLRTELDDAGVALELLHSTLPPELDERGDVAEIPWATRVPARMLPLGRGVSAVHQPVVGRGTRADLVVVEQATRMLANYALLLQQALGRTRVAFWGHGRDFDPGASGLGEQVKRVVSRHPWWWFAYNDRAAEVVRSLGYPGERITVVDNASDSTWLRERVESLEPDDLVAARQRWGVPPTAPVVTFVGAYVTTKDLPHLLATLDRLRAQVPDLHVLVAGDGPERPQVDEAAARRPWLTHVGPAFDQTLAEVLALTDVVLVPSWAGLVITDAFAAGTPVVVSGDHAHPPEVSYLHDGRNGLVVPGGADPTVLATAVADLLRSPGALTAMGAGGRASSRHFTAEAMAQRFASGLLAALASPGPARHGRGHARDR